MIINELAVFTTLRQAWASYRNITYIAHTQSEMTLGAETIDQLLDCLYSPDNFYYSGLQFYITFI